MNLSTTYLGMKLRTPFVPSASTLTQNPDNVKRMEDAGASAVVFHSLFEEQLRFDRLHIDLPTAPGALGKLRSPVHSPRPVEFNGSPDLYFEHLSRAKKAVGIPIIGSLNGTTFGGWTTAARLIEQAGADALELNIYSIPTDPEIFAEDIEQSALTILAAVKNQVKIPVAVKISPFYTNLANFARRLDRHGADGLVLFNRFYQPDINIETSKVETTVLFSTPSTLRLPLRWIAILRGRIAASLAATGGIHNATDAVKLIMAGADVTMLCSILMLRGIESIRILEAGLREWMETHGCESIEQLKGTMSQEKCPDPSAFERAQYTKAVSTVISK